MIKTLRIDIDKEIGERISRLGGSLPSIARYSRGEIVDDWAGFIREAFLTGRALMKRTGELYESVRGYDPKTGRQEHVVDFGVGIPGRLNYIHKWTGTDKDFMNPGRDEYLATGRYQALFEQNLERMERKLEVL